MFNFIKEKQAQAKVIADNKVAFIKGATFSGVVSAASTAAKVIGKTFLYTVDSLIEIAVDIKNIISPKVEAEEIVENNADDILSKVADYVASKWDSLVEDRPGRELSKNLINNYPYQKLALDVVFLVTNLVDTVIVTGVKETIDNIGDSINSGYEYAEAAKIAKEEAAEAEEVMIAEIESKIIELDAAEFMDDPVSVADVDVLNVQTVEVELSGDECTYGFYGS